MTRAKKGLLGLDSGHQFLLLECIANGLDTDGGIGDGLELALQLSGSIGFACGDKSHQLTAVIGGELMRTTTRVLFQSPSDLRTKFRDSRVSNTKSSCNVVTGVTIFQHRNDRVAGVSREWPHGMGVRWVGWGMTLKTSHLYI